MNLTELRNEIDRIDDELIKLFVQRMETAAKIAAYKVEHQLPVFIPAREQEKLADVAVKAGADMAEYTKTLYNLLFELSRAHQSTIINSADSASCNHEV